MKKCFSNHSRAIASKVFAAASTAMSFCCLRAALRIDVIGDRLSVAPQNCPRQCRPDAGGHAKTSADEELVGPLGLEPRTKGFTRPRRFRWEWTISSPSDPIEGEGAGRSSLSLSATAALR